MVEAFEITIFIISLIFWHHSKYPFLPQSNNIILFIIIGVLSGMGISTISFVFAKYYKKTGIKRFIFEFHNEYYKSSFFTKYVSTPLRISIPEELFFRGLLYSNFGFLITNILFSLVHIIRFTDKTVTFISIFIYGAIFTLLLNISGSLLMPIIAHYTFTALRIYYFPKYIRDNKIFF